MVDVDRAWLIWITGALLANPLGWIYYQPSCSVPSWRARLTAAWLPGPGRFGRVRVPTDKPSVRAMDRVDSSDDRIDLWVGLLALWSQRWASYPVCGDDAIGLPRISRENRTVSSMPYPKASDHAGHAIRPQ